MGLRKEERGDFNHLFKKGIRKDMPFLKRLGYLRFLYSKTKENVESPRLISCVRLPTVGRSQMVSQGLRAVIRGVRAPSRVLYTNVRVSFKR